MPHARRTEAIQKADFGERADYSCMAFFSPTVEKVLAAAPGSRGSRGRLLWPTV